MKLALGSFDLERAGLGVAISNSLFTPAVGLMRLSRQYRRIMS
jgi:hypothetical protein